MNKDSDRDIEHHISTSGLMEVLEISRSTVYRLMKKGLPNIIVGSGSDDLLLPTQFVQAHYFCRNFIYEFLMIAHQ
jgi:hypothetical protein